MYEEDPFQFYAPGIGPVKPSQFIDLLQLKVLLFKSLLRLQKKELAGEFYKYNMQQY